MIGVWFSKEAMRQLLFDIKLGEQINGLLTKVLVYS